MVLTQLKMFRNKQVNVLIPKLLELFNTRTLITSHHSNIVVGAKACVKKSITPKHVELFSEISGDWNPVHHKDTDAIVHGAYLNSLVSGVMGTHLPGPGTLVLKQSLRYPNPCFVNDQVTVTVEVTDVRKLITCKFDVVSGRSGNIVLEGDAVLMIKVEDKTK